MTISEIYRSAIWLIGHTISINLLSGAIAPISRPTIFSHHDVLCRRHLSPHTSGRLPGMDQILGLTSKFKPNPLSISHPSMRFSSLKTCLKHGTFKIV